MATCRLIVNQEQVALGEDDKFALAFARIENHYFVNGGSKAAFADGVSELTMACRLL